MTAQIYAHPGSGVTIIPILRELMPYPLPLLERIKFHHRSPSSQILVTFISSTCAESLPNCFAVAFLDRTRRPETECWIFLSGEVPGRCGLSSDSGQCNECQKQLLAMIDAIKSSAVPKSVHDTEALSQIAPAMLRAVNGEVILIGALHKSCERIIRSVMPECIIPPPVSGIDDGYIKYLFRPASLPKSSALPEGYRWGQLQQKDFSLVRSRTAIPRQDATLAILPSLAIFRDGDDVPIAWAFKGPDASLTSLHTETEHRGKGLAKLLVAKLFIEGGFLPTTASRQSSSDIPRQNDQWFHADTGLENASSRAVCRALGGQEGWLVHWIRIDVSIPEK